MKPSKPLAKDEGLNPDDMNSLLDSNNDLQHHSVFETTATKESKKPPEVLQIEDEYNALTSYDIVLRRGRCGRYFAKYV